MHIERVTLTNFRCFGPELTHIDLDPQLTAFIGGNGTGKTAIFQALMRIFGAAQEQRQVRIDDFHVPPDEDEPEATRSLTVEVVLAFPELDAEDEDDPESMTASNAVPEFFRQMAATVDGRLKCRFALVATWTDDGSVDGNVDEERRVVHTFDEDYGDKWSVLRPGDRNRVQVAYLPAARDGARQVTAFLRGRLWRASRWSDDLHALLEQSADELAQTFHSEEVVQSVEQALTARWQQLHNAGTDAIPTFEPIQRDVSELFRSADLLFDPTHTGRKNSAGALSDGQRSLLHLALTAATLDLENDIVSGELTDYFELAAASLPSLTLLAVEEPENHLSPFFLSRVVAQLTQLSEGLRTQSVLSSHSASALARVEPSRVRHIRRDLPRGTSTVHPIDLPADATEAGKYVREAVRAHPELYFARYVILGEGDSEELVIPLLAEARGVPIDRSFVAIVPLGGRHTNHFWKLLSSLQIPYATLIDLDWGRSGGGAGRLKTACAQLQSLGHDPFADIEGYDTLEDLEADLSWVELRRWTKHLRRWNVFFSQPLDLDMSLLATYFSQYSVLEDGATGPNLKSDPLPAVLGDAHPKVEFWEKVERKKLLYWYRYLFTTRSKPTSHLRALTAVPGEKLATPPAVLADLIDVIEAELSLP